tara:strand:+ start:880 stop:1305 length:426 start_codon:yes stop_codon:yes gene_type:complete
LKTIYIASDHAGYNLKKSIIKKYSKKLKITDIGTNNSIKSVNYAEYAHKACLKVVQKKLNIGILICGSGMGMAMSANKHKKIRAALCYSIKNAKLSRLHNDANVITLGARLTSKKIAFQCINTFLNTKFEGGRHIKRVKKI